MERRGLLSASDRFCSALRNNREALDYVRLERGLSDETVRVLGIGYCEEDSRSYLDINLQGRVTFPIKDVNGDILGFGGRLIVPGEPKYLNPSADSYDKSATLYNLDVARDYILECGKAVVVEGYMDVASMWSSGVRNVVASCGTAMTRRQLRLLKRFADEVYLLYDDDSSGNKSAERVFKLLELELFPVYVVKGLMGFDPDEYIRMFGRDNLLEVVYGAKT